MKTGLYIAIAVISGLAITLQGQFMGVMDRTLGTKESVFLTYASGGLLAALLLLVARGGNFRSWADVPWYAYTSGLLGLVIVGTIGWTVARIGTAKAFTLIVASQFILAAIIDHLGLLGAEARALDLTRVSGLGFLMLGVWLVVK